MQYLGEFLSTVNNINDSEDRVVKYFYYRPDRYDDHSANLENIFVLRSQPNFPKIGDRLSENNNYQITDIDIEKRVDDTNTGVKNVSYVVTCTYNSIGKIQIGYGDDEDRRRIDEDKNGNKVTISTPPWLLRNTYTRNIISVEVPFIKGYNSTNEQVIDVLNSAGKRLLASSTRYRFEYTINLKTEELDDTLANLSGAVINDDEWIPNTDGLTLFPEKTCLLVPPSYSVRYWQPPSASVEADYQQYFEYNVKFIYDPTGWDKTLLNIGTYARFNGTDQPSEQIYSYRTLDSSTSIWSSLQFGNLEMVQDAISQYSPSGVNYEKVTEPLPLTPSGQLDLAAIRSPETNPYRTKPFQEYPTYNFDLLTNI